LINLTINTPIQQKLRLLNEAEFPSVNIFKGFLERNELLDPSVVAKFLTWLLFDVENENFIQGDWDIYNSSHHQYWSQSGEVKIRS